MTVSEFAVLTLATTPLNNEAKAALTKAQAMQDEWHTRSFPNSPLSRSKRASAWLHQVEDPSLIMTIAQWDTVQAHMDCVASDTNKAIMAELRGKYIDTSKGYDIFHTDTDFLEDGAGNPLLKSPIISVSRLYVSAGKREEFAAQFAQVKPVLEAYAGPKFVRHGWREDLEEGANDEFVLVCGWKSVEKHYAFSDVRGFDQFSQLQGFFVQIDVKHYKRFI